MKAWSIEHRGDVSQLKPMDLPNPVAADGEILVEVKGSALNAADLKVLSGRDGGKFLHSNRFPIQMGFDYAGTVKAIGSGVKDWHTGQEVFGFLAYSMKTSQGSFAELIRVLPSQLAAKPKSAGFPEAAALATVASTALQALRDKGRLKSGQTVLINGASGGVGACAVQIAKTMGAKVWGTASAEKISQVARWGADEVIDYRKTSIREVNQTFDVILDAASTSSFGECASKLNSGGAYITLLPSPALLFGLIGSLFSSKSCVFFAVQSKQDDLSQIARWVDEGRLVPPVDKVFPMSQVPDAFKEYGTKNFKGKVALRA